MRLIIPCTSSTSSVIMIQGHFRSKKGWFKVDVVTSLTKEEENDRQQQVKIASGKQNARRTDHDDFPGKSAKRARTNNASL